MSEESKYAAILRREGFEPFDREELRGTIQAVYRSSNSEEGQEQETDPDPLEKKKVLPRLAENEPCFASIEISIMPGGGVTTAYDDTGQAWRINKVFDLEPYGFTHIFKPVLPN